jgi:hypothetical protein
MLSQLIFAGEAIFQFSRPRAACHTAVEGITSFVSTALFMGFSMPLEFTLGGKAGFCTGTIIDCTSEGTCMLVCVKPGQWC